MEKEKIRTTKAKAECKCQRCERQGHLEKDCWLKQKHAKGRVNQVSHVHASDSVSQAATSSIAAGTVRHVQVFDLTFCHVEER